MPAKRIWTEQERATIAGLLEVHTSTDDIAERFGISPQHMRTTLGIMGLRPAGWKSRYRPKCVSTDASIIPPRPSIPESRCQNWWPLPAGSDATWRAISDQPWPGHER